MHRMQPRDCPIVLRPLQLPAGPILRFSTIHWLLRITQNHTGEVNC